MIEINNLTRTFKDEKLLEKTVNEVIRGEKNGKLIVSVAVVGNKRMKAINKKYRKKNSATDVLSFPMVPIFPNKNQDFGEIIICPKQIRKKYFLRTVIHGSLHLFGYDHKTKKEERNMKKKEDYHLKKISLCQDQK